MIDWPDHPYVPGQSPRHDEGFFDPVTSAIVPGMPLEELAVSDCWLHGWAFFEAGFYWEAHELWEPLWMHMAPNSVERHFVRAVIQLANAKLKERMGRPKAALRLCGLAQESNDQARAVPLILGRAVSDVTRSIQKTKQEICIKMHKFHD